MKNKVYIFVFIVLSVTLATYYFKPVHLEKYFYAINKQFPSEITTVYEFQYENDKVITAKAVNDDYDLRCFAKNRWHFIWVKK